MSNAWYHLVGICERPFLRGSIVQSRKYRRFLISLSHLTMGEYMVYHDQEKCD
jgi:hypothetical protein